MASKKDKKNKGGGILLFLFIILIAIGFYYFYYDDNNENIGNQTTLIDTNEILKTKQKEKEDFIKAATDTIDTTEHVIIISNPYGTNTPYEIDKKAGYPVRYVYTGRRINISVTGLDNRIGTHSNHADANHVISILLDSGKIEIISVPRDTPADAGLEDSTGLNKLTVVRAVKGRKAYQTELARIAGVDKIHYWVEAGFSQVMGILEFFGFKDTRSTLQVLRSRTGLGGADYQRSYNQGQFIRQMILRHFNKLQGFSGEILIRAALTILRTNLTTAKIKDIIDQLEAHGFPNRPDAITVKIRPPMYIKFKVYNFSDESVIESLKTKIEKFNEKYIKDTTHIPPDIYTMLRYRLDLAAQDSALHPQKVIHQLKIMFNQHAWLQIVEPDLRDSIRTEFGILLSSAYLKRNRPEKARQVWAIINAEKALLNKKIEN